MSVDDLEWWTVNPERSETNGQPMAANPGPTVRWGHRWS